MSARSYGVEQGAMESVACCAIREPMEGGMFDSLMLAIGLGAFALIALYGLASERL